MKGYLPLIVLATLAMTGCAPSTVAQGSGSTDHLGAEETIFAEREKEEVLNPDAKAYAKDFGVSDEEADRRLDLQDDTGSLGAKLEKNEPETFAGLESRHKPDYHVVVYFSRDGEQTIQPYVEGTPLERIVEVKMVEASLKELEAAQEEAGRIYDELCLRAESGINITKNRVEVYVTDRERFMAALRRAGVELPEHVAVVEVENLLRPSVPSAGPIPRCG
jgi:hypothetical protein